MNDITDNAHSNFAAQKSRFDSSSKVSINAWLALTNHLEAVELSRGASIQESGRPVSHIYFLTSGVAQEFVANRQSNIVRAFHQAPAIVGNLSEFKRQRESHHDVAMIQAGSAMRISCEDFVELLEKHADLESWFLINMSRALLRHQQRLQSLLQLDHEKRLGAFVRDNPELANTLTSQQISEYLNIPAIIVNIMRKGQRRASQKAETRLLSA